MSEPRWYHERWALLMLLLLLPPVGLLAAATAPGVSVWKKLGWGLSLVMLAGIAAAVEQQDQVFSRLALDLTAAVHYQRGHTRHPARALDARIAEYEKAFRLEPPPGQDNLVGAPDSSDAAYRLGRAYHLAERYPQARLYLTAASMPAENPRYGSAQVALGAVELSLGLVERAAGRLNGVLDKHLLPPDDPELRLLRGRLLTHSDPAEARRTLMMLVWERQLGYLDEVHQELGAIAEAEKRHEDALAHYLNAVRVEPTEPDALEKALRVAQITGESPVAIRAFARACYLHIEERAGLVSRKLYEKLLERHPGFTSADICNLHIAWFYEHNERNSPVAARYYLRAKNVSKRPWLRVESLYKLGRACAAAGLSRTARESFQLAMQEAAPESYYRRASRVGLERLDKPAEARRKIERIEEWVDRLTRAEED